MVTDPNFGTSESGIFDINIPFLSIRAGSKSFYVALGIVKDLFLAPPPPKVLNELDKDCGRIERVAAPEDIPKISVRGLRRRSASFDDLLMMSGDPGLCSSDSAAATKPRHRRFSQSIALGNVTAPPRRQSMLPRKPQRPGYAAVLTAQGSQKILFGENSSRGRTRSRQSSTDSTIHSYASRSLSPPPTRNDSTGSADTGGEDGSSSDRSMSTRARRDKETTQLRRSVKADIEKQLVASRPRNDIVYTKLLRYTIGKAEWMMMGDNPTNPDPGGANDLGDSYERVLASVSVFYGSHRFAEDKSSSIELELKSLTLTNCHPSPQAMNFEPDAQMILRCSSPTKQTLTCPLLRGRTRAPPRLAEIAKCRCTIFFKF